MEITNEIKAKIFAQYIPYFIGTPAALAICQVIENYIISGINNKKFPDHRIELKPLSAISNEDAIEVAKIFHPGNDACQILRKNKQGDLFIIDIDSSHSVEYSLQVEFNFSGQGNIHSHEYSSYIKESNVTEAYQYLQSRGYALPYMNYTVEDLINANVYKIIE